MCDKLLEEKYVLEYIKDMLYSSKTKEQIVNNAKYHHNSSYNLAPSILTHGILSLSDLNRLGINKVNSKTLEIFSDTDSHINGVDSISLSVVGLTDMYRDEDEYNPYFPTYVDFRISNDIIARRSTINYGNEFLSDSSISVDKLRAIDIRLLKLIELVEAKKDSYTVKDVIDRYNYLRDIALTIKQNNLDIPFRDMSQDNITFDIDKVLNVKKLILK